MLAVAEHCCSALAVQPICWPLLTDLCRAELLLKAALHVWSGLATWAQVQGTLDPGPSGLVCSTAHTAGSTIG